MSEFTGLQVILGIVVVVTIAILFWISLPIDIAVIIAILIWILLPIDERGMG